MVTDTRPERGNAMTATPNQPDTQSALRTAFVARAVELGIDRETVWCPSPRAIGARRPDGSLLRLHFGDWPATDLWL